METVHTYFRCDKIYDCAGALHEDEGQECVQEAIQPSCLDWRIMGYTESGQYLINPDGTGTVTC